MSKEIEIKRVNPIVDWACKKCGNVEWDITDKDCRVCRETTQSDKGEVAE